MKNLFIAVGLMSSLVSCGNSNKVTSGAVAESGTIAITTEALVNFEGVYDLLHNEGNDCGASIRITQECGGYKIHSNLNNRPEDYCNINRADPRRPINPGSVTPPPDRDGRGSFVTQEKNQIRSIIRFDNNVSLTQVLTLNPGGTLVKVSEIRNRQNRCIYQKR